ncbi:MAG: hypothetical protein ACTSP5_13020 [Candidatus Heimdallarchaeota archaeon]
MIRISRSAPRTLLPNQDLEITLVVYAIQDIKDVEITETIGSGFILESNPEQRTIVFNETTHPELAFIPQGHTRSVSYKVKTTITQADFQEGLVIKISNRAKAKAKLLSGKDISSRIKADSFEVLAPLIVLKDIVLRDDLQSVVVFLENAGLVDAKSVCITFELGVHHILLRIEEFVMKISLKDFNNNEYKATSIMTRELKQALAVMKIKEAEFCASIIDLYEPDGFDEEQKIIHSHFEHDEPIEIEADGRVRPVLMPIAK